MLHFRILSALILLPLFIYGVLFAPMPYLIPILLFITLLAGWEWARLVGLEATSKRLVYASSITILTGLLLFAILPVSSIQAVGLPLRVSHYMLCFFYPVSVALFFAVILCLRAYPEGTTYWANPCVIATQGLIVLPSFIATIALFLNGSSEARYLLLYCSGLVFCADTGAYFSGHRWGKHKLLPNVSPGKTIEGVMGGIVLSLVVVAISLYCLGLSLSASIIWVLMAIVTVILSVIGDLMISMLKRHQQIKDTGALIPGHGGLLDRIDGMLIAIPIFAILLYCLTESL